MAIRRVDHQVLAIRRLARVHGIKHVRLFGSYATRTAQKTSDVDLLVDLQPEHDLLDLLEFKFDVETLLKCKVDVVTRRALSPYLRDRILRQARPL